MKLWIKFLIGTLIGILCARLLPVKDMSILSLCAQWTVRLGRYTVIPLVFSSAFIAIYRLRESHTYIKTGLWIIAVTALSAVLLTAQAVASSLLVTLPRLNISGAKGIPPDAIPNIAQMLFPSSAFSALCNGECVAASFLLGAFAGGAAAGDKIMFKPLIMVMDALSVLCYNVVTLFYEILPVGAIVLVWKWALDYRLMMSTLQCLPLLLLLLANLCFAAFILYPLLLFVIAKEKRPYKVLYAAIAPLFAAALSGDVNFCLPLVMRMGSEDFGVRRRVNAAVCPILVSFARAGAAVVAIVCFVAVWHSYSSLPMPRDGLVRLVTMSFALSFALCATPYGGAFLVFTIVCASFGNEFASGSAVLLPCAAFFSAIAAMFDVLTCAFGLVLIANKTHTMKARSVKDFI